MPFSFGSHALIDSAALSKFIWGVDDASSDLTVGLSSQDIFSVELAVNSISTQIMRHVSSEIKAASYTEVWDGAASDELVPTERPINSVTSIKFASNGDFSSGTSLPPETIYYDKYSIKLRHVRTPVGRGMVQVVYNAGYSTVPYDIQMASLLQFQWIYKKFRKGDAMVGLKTIAKSVGAGSESQSKDDSLKSMALISEVVGMLESYKRLEAPLSIMFTRVS